MRGPRAAEAGGQRETPSLGVERPHPHLERRLGHEMAAEVVLQGGEYLFGAGERAAEDPGRDPVLEGEPGGVDGLAGVVGLLGRDALAPHGHAVGVLQLEQQDAARPLRPRGDPKGLAQRELDLPEGEAREGQGHRAGVATGFSIVYISRNNGRSARTAQEGPLLPSPSPCQMPAAATRLVPWLPLLGLLACHAGPAAPSPGPTPEARYDVILADGKVVDGTGNAWFHGDVGVSGDRIAWVGPAGSLPMPRRRGGSTPAGMVVAPGFIDIQSGSYDNLLVGDGRSLSKVTQGITTEIMGEAYTPAPWNDAVAAFSDFLFAYDDSAAVERTRRGARRTARLRRLARCDAAARHLGQRRLVSRRHHAARPTSWGRRPGRRAPAQLDSMRALVRGRDGGRRLRARDGADLSARQLRLHRGADRDREGDGALSRRLHHPHAVGGRPVSRGDGRGDRRSAATAGCRSRSTI